MSRLLLLSVGLALMAMNGASANFSGKWSMTRQGGRGGAAIVLLLNQVGSEVTGNIAPPRGVSTGSPANSEILEGKADGETISFYIWTGLDQPVKNYYRGKLSGDDIVFAVTVDPAVSGQQPSTYQVTAKRAAR